MNRDQKKPIALITGASSGIGFAFAHEFARNGFDLILNARDRSRLEALGRDLKGKYQSDVTVIAADLSSDEGIEQLISQTESWSVEVLVNNAGFGRLGEFTAISWEDDRAAIELNIVALTRLTKVFAVRLRARGRGHILNVASTAAFSTAGPYMAVYYATKAYVLSYTEAVRAELSGTGVNVMAFCPGATQSEFQKNAGMPEDVLKRSRHLPTSANVAAYGFRALIKSEGTVIPGFRNRLAAFGVRLLPRSFVTSAVRRLQLSRLRPDQMQGPPVRPDSRSP